MFYGTATWTFNDGEVAEAPYANKWIIEGADTESPRIVLFQAFAVSPSSFFNGIPSAYFMVGIA